MFDVVLAILAIIGIFAMVNISVGYSKKAKKTIRKRTRAIKVTPSLSIEDKVMLRAGYATYSAMTIHAVDGDHHYLSSYEGNHLVPVYEVVMQDNNEFDLVLVNQEYVNVA